VLGNGRKSTPEDMKAEFNANPVDDVFKSRQLKTVAAIPCFNTGGIIGGVVSRASKYVDRVIVVDDGSTDNTAAAATAAGATVITHRRNRGYGGAIISCFEAAKVNGADALVILDGDGQHNPDEIPQILEPVVKGEADFVVGSRFLNSGVEVPDYRRFGINVITFLFNFGSRTKVTDAQSGFRAYGKNVLDAIVLSESGMPVSVELLVKARRRGFIIREAPISCLYDDNSSTQNPIRHGLGVAFSVIRLRLMYELSPVK